MNLFILRHASAGVRRLNPLLDVKRPLDKEGKQHCLRLAHVLNTMKWSFDLVVSSPLKRSLQTAQLVATEMGYEAQVQVSEALAPEAKFAEFQQLLAAADGRENVLVVGHNPNISLFLGSVLVPTATGVKVPQIRLRKGSLARVAMGRVTGGGPATLASLLDPRMVRALYAISTKSGLRKTSRK